MSIVLLLVCSTYVSGCSHNSMGLLQIIDAKGNTIAEINTLSDQYKELKNDQTRAYLQTVLSEAEEVIGGLRGYTPKNARDFLLKNGCSIKTAFNQDIFDAVKNGYESTSDKNLSFGCAVTDLQGGLLAILSDGAKDDENYATKKTAPYSSFKPICVYAPAIESGLANWSSVFLDAPVKKITKEDGQAYDWPVNATGIYANEPKTVSYAIKTSLNTVAVRCLQTVGLKNSFSFLESNFGLTLSFEKNKANTLGDDEVIGNVALGYLYDGVSPVDMAGYYQVFANGGSYSKPHTIFEITDQDGNTVYEYQSQERQVITRQTAYIMNKLLQNVVSAGGTGEKARCEGVAVGGKTGTGDDGNWFVGFTPQYTCAIWHGTEISKNISCDIFSAMVSHFDNESVKQFPNSAGIKKAAYCLETGKLFSNKCRKADMGYYASDNLPEACNMH